MVDLDHESIWISYCPMALEGSEQNRLGLFNSHHRLATPVSPWERLKIGGGTPPILTRRGHWLIVYHGVSEVTEPDSAGPVSYTHLDVYKRQGLDGLRDRLAEYSQMGARFAKWRAVIAMGEGIPTRGCIEANANALARYAACLLYTSRCV